VNVADNQWKDGQTHCKIFSLYFLFIGNYLLMMW